MVDWILSSEYVGSEFIGKDQQKLALNLDSNKYCYNDNTVSFSNHGLVLKTSESGCTVFDLVLALKLDIYTLFFYTGGYGRTHRNQEICIHEACHT